MKHGNTNPHVEVANYAIGRRLRELRDEAGISQNDLAKPLGISLQQVQKYEKGRNYIKAGTLVIMLDILRISPEDFFSSFDVHADPRAADEEKGKKQMEFLFS